MTDFGDNFLKNALGDVSSIRNSTLQGLSNLDLDLSSKAYDTDNNMIISDPFFNWLSIQKERYNQVYPYSLSMVRVSVKDGATTYSIESNINLPIPPTALSISVPVASPLTVTMKGIIEEHNGAPLRTINIQGTTGIHPTNSPIAKTKTPLQQVFGDKTPAMLDSIFPQTSIAVQNASTSINNLKSVFTGQTPTSKLIEIKDDTFLSNTGYTWFQRLGRFLDTYLTLKKKEANRDLRLVLIMYKDDIFYNVSLRNYSFNKAAGGLEYLYSLNLIAYQRLTSDQLIFTSSIAPLRNQLTKATDPNIVQRVLTGITRARRAATSIIAVLRGIRSDFSATFLGPLKEIGLLAKDITGIARTMADMPDELGRDLNSAFMELNMSGAAANKEFIDVTKKLGLDIVNPLKANTATGSDSANGSKPFDDEMKRYQTFKERQNVSSGNTPTGSPLEEIKTDPSKYDELYDQVSLDDLNLSDSQTEAINAEVQRVQNLTADDLRKKRDAMDEYIRDISDAFGGSNLTQRRIDDYSLSHQTLRKLNMSDLLLLLDMEQAIVAMDHMIIVLDQQQNKTTEDYYGYYASLAQANGVDFTRANSRFYIPFPHGSTLESLATQYLGDEKRWIEIAALNGLRPPYIDNDGFEKLLISNGSKNIIMLSDNQNIYVGQKITIKSDTQVPIARKIKAIDHLSDVQTLITVDGDTNLNIFKLADNAKIIAYLPDTVNSNNYIAIPSQSQSKVDDTLKVLPDFKEDEKMVRIAQVDLKLTSEGDLALMSSGDIMLSFGLANIIQASRIKLLTPQNSIIDDPSFGNPVQLGASSADIDLKAALASLNAMFTSDPRFSGVVGMKLSMKGPGASINMLLKVAEVSSLIPLTTEVPR